MKQEQHIRIGEFDVLIVRSKRRTLTLEASPQGVKVRAPMRMALKHIEAFVLSKSSWLLRSLERMPPAPKPLILTSGSEILYLGEKLELIVKTGRGLPELKFENNQLILPITESHLERQESTRRKLIKWYKAEATQVLDTLCRNLKNEMQAGSRMPKIKVRDYKRRWGSCSRKGELSFNWRIVMAPEAVVRYVVIHELAHRQEFNHSPKFWQIVANYDPNFKANQTWLSEQGHLLYRF